MYEISRVIFGMTYEFLINIYTVQIYVPSSGLLISHKTRSFSFHIS